MCLSSWNYICANLIFVKPLLNSPTSWHGSILLVFFSKRGGTQFSQPCPGLFLNFDDFFIISWSTWDWSTNCPVCKRQLKYRISVIYIFQTFSSSFHEFVGKELHWTFCLRLPILKRLNENFNRKKFWLMFFYERDFRLIWGICSLKLPSPQK